MNQSQVFPKEAPCYFLSEKKKGKLESIELKHSNTLSTWIEKNKLSETNFKKNVDL